MKKIEIYDPAMCCPTGVCGPSVDPELTRIASAVFTLEKKGIDIKRFNLANDPDRFVQNQEVFALIDGEGPEALPAILVDGVIVRKKAYPTNAELSEWTGVSEDDLQPKKPVTKIEL